MKIVFMGTPDIAVTALDALLRDGHEVVAVYTRPDKPVGRKQVLSEPPVKRRAAQNRILVEQPPTLRASGEADKLAAYAPDLVVVVAYGLILPADILAVPTHGCINLHVSDLPKYRGAAPIQRAIIAGEEEMGLCVMQMDDGVDTGPVLAREMLNIPSLASAGEVFETASIIGARLLAQTVAAIAAGTVCPQPQQGEGSYAPQLKKAEAELDFARPAVQLHNLVRGCNPWPLGWFVHAGKRVKVLRARLADAAGQPGEIASANPLVVCCGEGALLLENVLPEGKRAMSGAEWAAGKRFSAGQVL